MKILYNQSQLKRILILGILFLLIGTVSLFTSIKIYLSGFTGLGIMNIVIYFVQKNRAYIRVTNEYVRKDGFFPKRIEIESITSVKYFAGDYIIKSPGKEIIIDTNIIDKESLPLLKDYFAKYLK